MEAIISLTAGWLGESFTFLFDNFFYSNLAPVPASYAFVLPSEVCSGFPYYFIPPFASVDDKINHKNRSSSPLQPIIDDSQIFFLSICVIIIKKRCL
jgi:hypothetical protein